MGETGIQPSGGPDSDRDRESDAPGRSGGERDYGDSAGYGGGGSTLDYDEVLGDETSRRDIGPNPLDAVVHTGRDRGDSGAGEGASEEEPGSSEKLGER